jgi:hypothetical protein
MNVADLEALPPADRTALAKKLARRGEEVGHELAKSGHPVVVKVNSFHLAHAEKRYITGEYAQTTLSAMAQSAAQQVAREITEEPGSSRMPVFYWTIAICYVLGFAITRAEKIEPP